MTAQQTTLTIAIASLFVSVLAALGTGAQAYWARRMATRRYDVAARFGLMGVNGVVVHKDRVMTREEREINARQSYDRPVFGVIVRNTGALPIVVNKWSLNAGYGDFSPLRDSIGKPLPYEIPAGGSESWWADAAIVVETLKAFEEVLKRGPARSLVGKVECGDGSVGESKPLHGPSA